MTRQWLPTRIGHDRRKPDATGLSGPLPGSQPQLESQLQPEHEPWPEREPGEQEPHGERAVRVAGLRELRGATARRDVDAIVAALAGRDPRPVLQHAGAALLVALGKPSAQVRALAAEVVSELRSRGWPGDSELGDDLEAMLRDEPAPGRPLPVVLDALEALLEGGEFAQDGGYLDLETGEVLHSFMTDPFEVGADAVVDVEQEPERWLAVPTLGVQAARDDLVAFADGLTDRPLAERLRDALAGRGAFRRFRQEIETAGLIDRWNTFADERRAGRARAWLAANGIRALPR